MLKLRRRHDVEFQAFHVRTGDFQLGGIQRQDHSPVETWIWTIGNVNVHADGRGPAHGSGRSRDDVMAMLATRWRLWLSLAGLREIEDAGASPQDPLPLTLTPRERGPSEDYAVATNGVTLGLVGRTFGMDASRWYWTFSAVYDQERAWHPRGGGLSRDEALAGFTEAWRAWLAQAGLHGSRDTHRGQFRLGATARADQQLRHVLFSDIN